MTIILEKINKIDLIKALKIYNYYIANSFANFEEKVLTENKFNQKYKKIKSKKLPFILAKKNNDVIGLAFVNNFREKSGYKYTFEHSIYINPNFISQGYGSVVLKELVKVCRRNKKIKNLIAVIGGSNNYA